MYPEAYRQWIEIFNDDFVQVWHDERKELKKVALLLSALQKELKNIQTNVEVEVLNLKQKLKYKDDLENKMKSVSPPGKKKSPNTINKENNLEKLKLVNNPKKGRMGRDSPDLFKDIDLNAQCSSTDISVIDLSISDDDITKAEGSPTIKKRRKRYKFIPNPPVFSIMVKTDDKPATPLNTVGDSVKANLFKTPIPKLDHDLSVIEGTPDTNTNRYRTSSRVSKKKSMNLKNNSTLTQMFRSSTMKKRENGENSRDSDETYFETEADQTEMGITDLLDYINKDGSNHKNDDENGSIRRRSEGESICENMETSSQEVDQFSKGGIFNEEDIQSSSEKPRIVVEPEPVVRGKARKQLHGWSCQECKNFYGRMKLSPEEIQKKMDECSRHRYKYCPPEETMPGFWDLSIPPEKLE